jgi:hypothetical protein
VAHQLVTEEVERDAIGVPPRQLAPEQLDVERFGFVEVTGRDCQVEGVVVSSHGRLSAQYGFNWILPNEEHDST